MNIKNILSKRGQSEEVVDNELESFVEDSNPVKDNHCVALQNLPDNEIDIFVNTGDTADNCAQMITCQSKPILEEDNNISSLEIEEKHQLNETENNTEIESIEKSSQNEKEDNRQIQDGTHDDESTIREIKGRYVLGEIAGTFKQKPFPIIHREDAVFHRSDIIGDVAKIGNLLLIGASIRGESHYASQTPRQDSFIIEQYSPDENSSFAFAIIADGVGNASKSDDFSEVLVNYLSPVLKELLHENRDIYKIDWDYVADYIWKVGVNYCYKMTNSEYLNDYFSEWASTLELVVIDASGDQNKFVQATISGDGGTYVINDNYEWETIKAGKNRSNNMVSNDLIALPNKPKEVLVHKGVLHKGDTLLLATDGLTDYIEEYREVRDFFGRKLNNVRHLPEFIRIISVAVKQMNDDKTGIVIKQWESDDN